MFDIGWTELLLVAVLAIVFVGPKDLPKLMRTVGQYTARMRKMAREFQQNFEDLARESELEDLRREMAELRGQAMAPVSMGVDAAMAKASGQKPAPEQPGSEQQNNSPSMSDDEASKLVELPEAMQDAIKDAHDVAQSANSTKSDTGAA